MRRCAPDHPQDGGPRADTAATQTTDQPGGKRNRATQALARRVGPAGTGTLMRGRRGRRRPDGSRRARRRRPPGRASSAADQRGPRDAEMVRHGPLRLPSPVPAPPLADRDEHDQTDQHDGCPGGAGRRQHPPCGDAHERGGELGQRPLPAQALRVRGSGVVPPAPGGEYLLLAGADTQTLLFERERATAQGVGGRPGTHDARVERFHAVPQVDGARRREPRDRQVALDPVPEAPPGAGAGNRENAEHHPADEDGDDEGRTEALRQQRDEQTEAPHGQGDDHRLCREHDVSHRALRRVAEPPRPRLGDVAFDGRAAARQRPHPHAGSHPAPRARAGRESRPAVDPETRWWTTCRRTGVRGSRFRSRCRARSASGSGSAEAAASAAASARWRRRS